MNIRFLGTGAADWSLPNDEEEKNVEYRRYCSAIVTPDDDEDSSSLLIDPGPHIFHFAVKKFMPYLFDDVRNVLITHSHSDHFNPSTIVYLNQFIRVEFWGTEAVANKLLKSGMDISGVSFNFIEPGKEYRIGDFKVLPLRANHVTDDPNETVLNYVIEKNYGNGNVKRIFYGLDSSWFDLRTWNTIRHMKMDAMVLECTIGDMKGDYRIFEHTSIPMLEIMLDTIRSKGYCGENARIYVSHMARTLHGTQKELEERLAPLNVIPAYDGMVAEV